MKIGDWKGLQRISPGPITKEVKDILKIKSAKDAKIQAGNEKSKAIKDPGAFRKDINISQNDDFAKLMKSILSSKEEFKVLFNSVNIMNHPKNGKIAKVALSTRGTDVISTDSQLIRFYKFWFDSILWACLNDRVKKQRRDAYVRYRRDAKNIYVWYAKA